jgi:hypothetical protein
VPFHALAFLAGAAVVACHALYIHANAATPPPPLPPSAFALRLIAAPGAIVPYGGGDPPVTLRHDGDDGDIGDLQYFGWDGAAACFYFSDSVGETWHAREIAR